MDLCYVQDDLVIRKDVDHVIRTQIISDFINYYYYFFVKSILNLSLATQKTGMPRVQLSMNHF